MSKLEFYIKIALFSLFVLVYLFSIYAVHVYLFDGSYIKTFFTFVTLNVILSWAIVIYNTPYDDY